MDYIYSYNRGAGTATTCSPFYFSLMKKISFYFSHDYNASDDHKCLFLRQQLGMEGYGIFWFLVEKLAQAGGSLPLKILPSLSMQMQVSEAKVNAVINGFELFEIHDFTFFSNRLNDHINERKLLSQKGKEGSEKRWNKNSPPISLPNSPVNTLPYSRKGKESISSLYLELLQALELTITQEGINELSEFYEFENLDFENQKQEIMYVVQEMMKIYQKKDPDHFFDKETDYHACYRIAQHIAKAKNWRQAEIVSTKSPQILESWDKITDFIVKDLDWFAQRSLDFISTPKHWQELLKKMKKDYESKPKKSQYEIDREAALEKYRNRGSASQ